MGQQGVEPGVAVLEGSRPGNRPKVPDPIAEIDRHSRQAGLRLAAAKQDGPGLAAGEHGVDASQIQRAVGEEWDLDDAAPRLDRDAEERVVDGRADDDALPGRGQGLEGLRDTDDDVRYRPAARDIDGPTPTALREARKACGRRTGQA